MRPNKATHSKLSLWTITLTSQNVELQLARQYLIHFLLKKNDQKTTFLNVKINKCAIFVAIEFLCATLYNYYQGSNYIDPLVFRHYD